MQTGVLEVVGPAGTETFSWNGKVADRKKAREAFEGLMKEGHSLAYVEESPGKSKQVRTFEEIEEHEREHGLVSAFVTPAIVGG